MTQTEEMARELVSILREGPIEATERAMLAVKSFEFGMHCAMGVNQEQSLPKTRNTATQATA